MTRQQFAWFVGLVVCVCTALLGQAEMVGEPWRHWISVVGIVGTAANGYMMQPPRMDTKTRTGDPPHKDD